MNLDKAVTNDIFVKMRKEIEELQNALRNVFVTRDKMIKKKDDRIKDLERKLKIQNLRGNIVVKLFFEDELNYSS